MCKVARALSGFGQGLANGLQIMQQVQHAPIDLAIKKAHLENTQAHTAALSSLYSKPTLDYSSLLGNPGGTSPQGPNLGNLAQGLSQDMSIPPVSHFALSPAESVLNNQTQVMGSNGPVNIPKNSVAPLNQAVSRISSDNAAQSKTLQSLISKLATNTGSGEISPWEGLTSMIPAVGELGNIPGKQEVFQNELSKIIQGQGAPAPTTASQPTSKMNAQDIQAVTWAKAHPDAPEAKLILQKFGM